MNLQISPQISRPITLAAGTNEVAMWALQLYIVPFSKLPYSIPGAPSIHFPILSSTMGPGSRHLHSHIPWATIHPRPPGSIFLTSRPGMHAYVQNYQIIVICSLSSYIVHVGYLVFMCAGTWSPYISATLSGINRLLACNHSL
jgi:hypothetical protein